MTGYFDDILDAYAPDAPALADPLWSNPFDAETDPDLALPDAPAPDRPEPDTAPPPAAAAAPEWTAPPAPPDIPDAPDPDSPDAPSHDRPADRIIERELRVVEHIPDTSEPAPPVPDPGAPDRAPEFHEHTRIDQEITHLHEHVRIVDETDFAPEGAGPPPEKPATPPLPAPDVSPDTPDLGALEAQLADALAGLHGEDAAPTPFLSPDDFEPEAADAAPPPDIDPVREITREVVTEHHHHHTIETRIEPAATPPPKTAAEASQIGPIRFSSDWKTGGR